jgi:hypothetical protein
MDLDALFSFRISGRRFLAALQFLKTPFSSVADVALPVTAARQPGDSLDNIIFQQL